MTLLLKKPLHFIDASGVEHTVYGVDNTVNSTPALRIGDVRYLMADNSLTGIRYSPANLAVPLCVVRPNMRSRDTIGDVGIAIVSDLNVGTDLWVHGHDFFIAYYGNIDSSSYNPGWAVSLDKKLTLRFETFSGNPEYSYSLIDTYDIEFAPGVNYVSRVIQEYNYGIWYIRITILIDDVVYKVFPAFYAPQNSSASRYNRVRFNFGG